METRQAAQTMPDWKVVADEIWAIIRENAQGFKELRESQKENAQGFKELRESQKENAQGFKELRESQRENAQGFKELRESQRESQKENAQGFKELRERQRENAQGFKELRESQRETEKQMKATDKRFGELVNRFGDMVEYMVMPNLVAKFEELGFTFTKANRTEIKDRKHGIFTEVDALLENGDKVMAVEIKTKPNIGDVNDHIKRMEKLRTYADMHGDRRVYLGAVAGVVFNENEKTYALKQGFYVVEPSGETFKITEPKDKYHPREWQPAVCPL